LVPLGRLVHPAHPGARVLGLEVGDDLLEEGSEGLVLEGPGLEGDLSADVAFGGLVDDVGRWSAGGSRAAAGEGGRGGPASSGDERGAARRSHVQGPPEKGTAGQPGGAARQWAERSSGAAGCGGRVGARRVRRSRGPS